MATAHAPAQALRARRIATLRAGHSYWAVLGAILVAFLFSATAPDAAWATSVLVLVQTGTLVLALWTGGWTVHDRTTSFGLAAVGAAAATVNLLWVDTGLTAGLGILSGLLTVATAVVIAAGALRQGEVNIRSVGGAICVWVLFGMLFVFVYSVVATLDSGPFFAQGTDGTRALRTYFSFVTLATLGYGDYTPAGNLGHALAVIEALIGQLYLVTVVAVVVTRMRPRRER